VVVGHGTDCRCSSDADGLTHSWAATPELVAKPHRPDLLTPHAVNSPAGPGIHPGGRPGVGATPKAGGRTRSCARAAQGECHRHRRPRRARLPETRPEQSWAGHRRVPADSAVRDDPAAMLAAGLPPARGRLDRALRARARGWCFGRRTRGPRGGGPTSGSRISVQHIRAALAGPIAPAVNERTIVTPSATQSVPAPRFAPATRAAQFHTRWPALRLPREYDGSRGRYRFIPDELMLGRQLRAEKTWPPFVHT